MNRDDKDNNKIQKIDFAHVSVITIIFEDNFNTITNCVK